MKRILTSIWFISAVIAIPIMVFMPPLFEKYVVKELSKEPINYRLKNPQVIFDDLFSEGIEKRVCFGDLPINGIDKKVVEYSVDKPLIVFYGNADRRTRPIFIADLNQNKRKEILGFSFKSDSLFLNVCELGLTEIESVVQVEHYFIEFPGGDLTWTRIISGHFEDMDNDGFDEFVFSLGCHEKDDVFSAVHYFDLTDRSIKRSEVITDLFLNLQFKDIDMDGKIEIVADGVGSNHQYKKIMAPGSESTFVKILDNNLNLKGTPIQFNGGATYTILVNEKGEIFFYTLSTLKLTESPQNVIYKYNPLGSRIDSLYLPAQKRANIIHLAESGKGELIAFAEKGKIHRISKGLKVLEVLDLSEEFRDIVISDLDDINEDGTYEYFCGNFKTGNEIIFTEDFSEDFIYNTAQLTYNQKGLKVKKNQFFSNDGNYSYLYSFGKNPYRLLKFPVFAGIYFMVLLLTFIIRKSQESRLEEKFELQNKVRELQLQSLNNQLDPHFIFNTFNTVASVVRQGKSEEAYNLMVQFSKLVRHNLDDSGGIYTTLQRELNFVKDYLSIQKFRFKDLFTYSIVMESGINKNLSIPKLLIQIHVENALKHGIRPLKNEGILKIEVKKEAGLVLIEIEDNGVGRKKSKKLNTEGHGIGVKTLNSIVDLSNQNSKNKIEQNFVDLVDDQNKAIGTKVQIWIS